MKLALEGKERTKAKTVILQQDKPLAAHECLSGGGMNDAAVEMRHAPRLRRPWSSWSSCLKLPEKVSGRLRAGRAIILFPSALEQRSANAHFSSASRPPCGCKSRR